MRKRRLVFLAVFVAIGLLIWQLPTLLKAIPSRYVAAYLPEPLQALAERDHVETLPTADVSIDAAALLARRDPVTGDAREPNPETGGTLPPVITTRTDPTPPAEQLSTRPTPPTPTGAPTATATSVPVPSTARIGPITHHFQTWNNCGPATLAMALSYFDIRQGQEETASILKPDPEDRNVSPYEIADYVNNHTDLSALSRTNGDITLLRRLVAGGYPVIIELGLDPPGEYRWMGWYGHYLLAVAYDDQKGQVWVYDSWFGTSEVPGANASPDGRVIAYNELDTYWRQFGRNYIVLFETQRQADVAEIIGGAMDDNMMWRAALARTREEISGETSNAFLWFNLGTIFNALGDFEDAAAAFDQARALGLPWRMLWYQFGPYEAYYQVGRYDDVVLLANATLMDRPYFEESYYYRGLAMAALGNVAQTQTDLEKAVRRNPNFTPAVEALAQLDT
ncbi:MAG: C39 family peptidase [Chloroflexota bacterium]|jgi:hypothetical protein